MRDAQRRVARATRVQSRGRALATATLPLATAVATVGCALVAARTGHSAPVSALLVLAPFAFAEVFTALPDAARAWARASAADRRLTTLLDERPAVAALARPVTLPGSAVDALTGRSVPHLRLRGVGASWDGRRTALRGADLDVAPGRVVAVTGPSGCGKSTLLAVLARQLDPAAGSYLVDGRDALGLPLEKVRELFAVVDDEPHVFATTLRENLRLARPAASTPDRTGPTMTTTRLTAARAAGLGAWFAGLPDGLATRLGAGGRGLSGGERARLSIARALLSGRPVLLLDEPVAHLDHPTALAVMADLLAARGERSVVVVSHRPEGLAEVHGIMDLTRTAAVPDAVPTVSDGTR